MKNQIKHGMQQSRFWT